MPVCRECIQPIIWLTTNANKKMPVNMTPVYIVVGEGKDKFVMDGNVVSGRLAKSGEKSKKAFVPHWATCTAPEKFRDKEKAPPPKPQDSLFGGGGEAGVPSTGRNPKCAENDWPSAGSI